MEVAYHTVRREILANFTTFHRENETDPSSSPRPKERSEGYLFFQKMLFGARISYICHDKFEVVKVSESIYEACVAHESFT